MIKGRKKETHLLKEKSQPSWTTNCSITARNLPKRQLSGVIFGCKHSTINECHSKQLFGLPAFHISYVRNINPGLPLFLFNYTDRVLYGVFEAASHGQLNIDPYGWTDGSHETPFPAQVKFRIRIQCQPLTEAQFAPVIAKNYYYEQKLFWFELDRDQTVRLISLFSVSPVTASPAFFKHADNFGSFPKPYVKWKANKRLLCDTQVSNSKVVYADQNRENVNFEASSSAAVALVNDHREADHGNSSSGQPYTSIVRNTTTNAKIDNPPQKAWSSLFKVTKCNDEQKEVEDVKSAECSDIDWESSSVEPCCKEPQSKSSADDVGAGAVFSSMGRSNNSMPTENTTQVDKDSASMSLDKNHSSNVECSLSWDLPSSEGSQQLEVDETSGPDYQDDKSIIKDNHLLNTAILSYMDPHSIECLVRKLLLDVEESKSLVCKKDQKIKYLDEELVRSKIEIQRLQRMFKESEIGSSSSIGPPPKAKDCSILISGGYDGSAWISSLDCYYPHTDILIPLSSMSSVRSYGTAMLNGELFIIGGLDDTNSWYKTVESYNTVTDHWTNHPPLSKSKGGIAAVTLLDKVFAIGGGNGTDYFPDVEMYDPGAGRWIRMCSLVQKRFAATAATINGMIYVVGGYDGTKYLNSFETIDPRAAAHSRSKPGTMAAKRGCHSLVVLNEKLYSMGGYDGGTMVASMEIFEPRVGTWMIGESMTVARGYFGAVVMGDGICAMGGLKDDNNISDTVEYYSEGRGWQITDTRAIGKRCHFSAIVVK